MNSRIRTSRGYMTLAIESLERDAREEKFAAAAPLSQQFESSFQVEPSEAQSSSNTGLPVLTKSSAVLSTPYNIAIQDPRMSFAFYVEGKFIPEHVEHKKLAGKTHYQAMLKHLLSPETVTRMFNPRGVVNARLKSVPGWPYLDDVRMCDITSDHVRRLMASASAQGYSSQTITHMRNVFFAIISRAQKEGCFVGPNPVSQVKSPPMARKAQPNLTISQTRAILDLMQYPDRDIALFSLMTGMNIVEICELGWKDVNLSNSGRYVEGMLIPPRSIAVRKRWNRSGLGDAQHGQGRIIEIQAPLLSHLWQLRIRDSAAGKNGFVLVSDMGNPIAPESIRADRLRRIRKRLGIPWLSWQVLRRGYRSLLGEYRTQLADQMMGRLPKSECSHDCDPVERPGHENPPEAETHSHRNFCFGLRSA